MCRYDGRTVALMWKLFCCAMMEADPIDADALKRASENKQAARRHQLDRG